MDMVKVNEVIVSECGSESDVIIEVDNDNCMVTTSKGWAYHFSQLVRNDLGEYNIQPE